jgi:hypothetical protein
MVVTAVACGDGSTSDGTPPVTCNKVAGCGGTVTGTWKMVEACVDQPRVEPPAVMDLCETAKLEVGTASASGTVVYKDDGTFTQMTTIETNYTIVLGPTCLKQTGATLTCKQVEDLKKDKTEPVTCTSSGGGCRCVGKSTTISTDAGTFTVSVTTLTAKIGSDMRQAEYCVKGTDLYLASNPQQASDLPLTGQVKLQKQ